MYIETKSTKSTKYLQTGKTTFHILIMLKKLKML